MQLNSWMISTFIKQQFETSTFATLPEIFPMESHDFVKTTSFSVFIILIQFQIFSLDS